MALAHLPEARLVAGTGADNSGTVEHQSSNFARNLLDEAWATVESDAGTDLVVDRDSTFRLRRRRWWEPPAVGTPHPRWNATRATWTNGSVAGAFVYCPTAFGTGLDLDDVANQVSMARAGGTAYTVQDSDSIVRYGLRTYQRFDLTCRYDAAVEDAAELRLDRAVGPDRSGRRHRVAAGPVWDRRRYLALAGRRPGRPAFDPLGRRRRRDGRDLPRPGRQAFDQRDDLVADAEPMGLRWPGPVASR